MPEGTLHEAGEKGNGQLVAAGDGSEIECHSGIPPYSLWRRPRLPGFGHKKPTYQGQMGRLVALATFKKP
jgi:hypothetical protein